ncbi:hypothetical protein GGER_44320 [Serratia rubidaea]
MWKEEPVLALTLTDVLIVPEYKRVPTGASLGIVTFVKLATGVRFMPELQAATTSPATNKKVISSNGFFNLIIFHSHPIQSVEV